jgi:hypothetical protein
MKIIKIKFQNKKTNDFNLKIDGAVENPMKNKKLFISEK